MAELASNGNGPSITADEALESVREAWHKTYGAAPYSSSIRNLKTNDTFGYGSPDAEEREQMQQEAKERIQKGQRYDHRPVYEIFKEVAETARQSIRQSLAGSERIGDVVRPKLTIDLSRQKLDIIPEEVVEILKDDVERLVLSHNYIWHLPLKFAECVPLKYLNLRANNFKEIPKAVSKLPQLEILDMSRNKIVVIPEEVTTMKALRVLSLMNNRIEDVPICVGSLDTLRILKLAGNLLPDGLKRIVEGINGSSSPTAALVTDNERDVLRTRKLKKYLKAEAAARESGGDSSDGPLDTPRPLKRNLSVRFPVVPAASGSESASDVRSPAYMRSPALSRSHMRTPSFQNNPFHNVTLRRPGIAPLALGNDRNRSNSESALQATRNKRMGIVTKKNSDLGTLDETRPSRLGHHFRGESYGSVLRDRNRPGPRNIGGFISNPATPAEVEHQRGTFVRRLSSLPEHKRESHLPDKVAECASGILFSLYILAPKVPELLAGLRKKNATGLNLPGVYLYASDTLETLDEGLHRYEQTAPENREGRKGSRKKIRATCKNSIIAYLKLGKILLLQLPRLIADADHRYIRSLLFMVHHSLVELRNAYQCLDLKPLNKVRQIFPGIQEETLRDRNLSATPTRDRPQPLSRLRTGTALHTSSNANHFPSPPERSPSVPQNIASRSRSNSRTNTMGNCIGPLTSAPRNESIVMGGLRYENIQPGPPPGTHLPTYFLLSRSNTGVPGQALNGETSASVPATPLVRAARNIAAPSDGARREVLPAVPTTPGTHHSSTVPSPEEAQRQAQFTFILSLISMAVDHAIRCLPTVREHFKTCLQMGIETPGTRTSMTRNWARLVQRTSYALETARTLGHQTTLPVNPTLLDDQDFWDQCIKLITQVTTLLSSLRAPIARGLLDDAFVHSLRPMRVSCRTALSNIRKSPWQALAAEVPHPISAYQLSRRAYITDPNDPTKMVPRHPKSKTQSNPAVTQTSMTPTNGLDAGGIAPIVHSTSVQPTNSHSTNANSTNGQSTNANTTNAHSISIPATSAPSTSVPATPLSAALGPAAQATVPAVQGLDASFQGGFFQRADALLSGQQTRFTGNRRV